jgi:hypothetical protein
MKTDYEKIYNWQELNLRSMDIIVCAGTSTLSNKIRKFNRLVGVKGRAADQTHAAGIYKGLPLLHSKLEVFESTTLNKWANKSGVQKNFFEDWLENYAGQVHVIKLKFDRSKSFYDNDFEFWQKHKFDKYESGIPGALELFFCGLKLDRIIKKIWPSYKPAETNELHCTELVIKRLQHHSLMTKIVLPNRMPPSTFWTGGDLYKYLLVSASEPIRIK